MCIRDSLRILASHKIVMNSPEAIQNAANKFYSAVLFSSAGLPVPKTVVTESVDVALNALEDFGGSAVAKPIFGHQGKGVEKITLDASAREKIQRIIAERGVIYLQEFIPNAERDIRVFVVGDEIVGAIYRVRRSGSIVSNLSMGGKPVVFHCEDQELVLRGRRSEAATEVSAVRSVLSAALSLNANVRAEMKINIAHVSSEETVLALRTFRNHTDAPRVFCEVTPHHLFFSEKDAARNRMLRVNPPLRSERSRRMLLNALKRGEIDFIASDHAPHTAAEKAEGAAGVPNLDTFGSFVGWLILRGVSPCRIASACAAMPASFLSLNDRGRIEEGKRADFTILDLKRLRKISSEDLYTKCGWSPFEGCEFPSVKHTIVKGEVKSEYDDVFDGVIEETAAKT